MDGIPPLTPLLRSFRARLGAPVPALSLAAFRIALGALLIWDCWRFLYHDRIYRYFVAPDFHFTYPGFGWVAPLPDPWIHLLWLVMGAAAFLVAIGLFYRASILTLTLVFTYFFLLDRAEYLNHFYLVILFLILLCFMPAARAWSVDAWRRPPPEGPTVPFAAVFLLRLQMEIVLIFAGLVKLTPDWLAGEPLGLWLRAQFGDGPLGALLAQDWAILAGAWGTIALHLVGAPLLLWHRTRLATFAAYAAFHIANAQAFNIGIFPWLTIAATTIFFPPDWPHRLARRCLGPFQPLPPHAPPQATPHAPLMLRPARALPAPALAGMALWVAIQIALPLRASLFPTEVRWSGDGHEFSWRMRIYDRSAEGRFRVIGADGTEWIIDPTDYLTHRQASKMIVRPDMIHQFAQHLEQIWRNAGHADVAVHADIVKSLNGRPPQRFIDPETDLTSVPLSHFGPDPWVLPLAEPVWGLRHNRNAEKPAPPEQPFG